MSTATARPEAPSTAETRIAGHLLAGATAFFFLAFLFAYFYLRTLDKPRLWQPAGVHASTPAGTLVVVLLVASAAAADAARRSSRPHGPTGRIAALSSALALGTAAMVAQIIEWLTLGFGPGSGGYASVFVGWTGFYAAFVMLALLRLEVELATAIRHPEPAPVSLGAVSFYWSFLVGIGVVTWIVLYLL